MNKFIKKHGDEIFLVVMVAIGIVFILRGLGKI